MITVGEGSRWAANQKELKQSLFDSGGTANGTYRAFKRKVMFYSPSGEPVACLCLHDHTPFFVTATNDYGRVRYLFSYTERTKMLLSLPDSIMQQADIGERIKKEVMK